MGDSPTAGSSYRAQLAPGAHPTEDGLAFRDGDLLAWSEIEWAVAAEIGEPEGVRTIVFDLIVERGADGCAAYRLDADPGEDAMVLARAIEAAVGPDRAAPSIKSVASDGIPSRCHSDLETFEAETLASLGRV